MVQLRATTKLRKEVKYFLIQLSKAIKIANEMIDHDIYYFKKIYETKKELSYYCLKETLDLKVRFLVRELMGVTNDTQRKTFYKNLIKLEEKGYIKLIRKKDRWNKSRIVDIVLLKKVRHTS